MESSNQSSPQNHPSQQTQNSQAPTPPKKKFKSIHIIILLIFIAVLIPLVYIFLAPQKNSQANNKSLSKKVLNNPALMKLAEKLPIPKITLVAVTPVPAAPEPSSSPSAYLPQNWNTYKNTEPEFSLDYPADFTAGKNSHGLGVSDITIQNPRNTDSQNFPDFQILIYPKMIGKLIGQDFDVLYNLPQPSTRRMTMADQKDAPQIFTKIKNRTISGLKAFDFTTTDDPPAEDREAEIGIYIEIEDSTMIISTKESNAFVLEHMLTTLRTSP